MTDFLDWAQDVETREREASIARVVDRVAPAVPLAKACVACGDDLDPQRTAAHPAAVRCLTCQEALERFNRTHSKGLYA